MTSTRADERLRQTPVLLYHRHFSCVHLVVERLRAKIGNNSWLGGTRFRKVASIMSTRLALSGVILVGSLGLAVDVAHAGQRPHWITVSHKTISGLNSTALVAGTVKHPGQLRFQVRTTESSAEVSWGESCSKGSSEADGSGSYTVSASQPEADHPFRPSISKAQRCTISAKASQNGAGSLSIALQQLVN